MMTGKKSYFLRNACRDNGLFLLALLCMGCLFTGTASAAQTCLGGTFVPPAQGQGMLTQIVISLQGIVDTVTAQMFQGIANNAGFQLTLRATVTIYVAVYGILFMFGMVELTISEFAVRMIKIGVVSWIISPSSWTYFNYYVVRFFNGGTNDIIAYIININSFTASVNNGNTSGAPPFYIVDYPMAILSSTKLAVTGMATFITGPYGPMLALILLVSMGSILKGLLMISWVYLMSMVLRALLFGLAPIFFVFLLFTRTRHLFDGWLNQVINACLQPIFLFLMAGYVIALVEGALLPIYSYKVCYIPELDQQVPGSPYEEHGWHFPIYATDATAYAGDWGWNGPKTKPGPIFPIALASFFMLLAAGEVMRVLPDFVTGVSNELAGASINLAGMQGGFSNMFSPAEGSKSSAVGNLKPTPRAPPQAPPRANPPGFVGPPAPSGPKYTLDDIKRMQAEKGTIGLLEGYRDNLKVGKR